MSRHYILMLRHWEKLNFDVAFLKLRCRDIEKEFSSFKQKIFTCLPHFISAISVHACEYKSINIEESQFKHEQ